MLRSGQCLSALPRTAALSCMLCPATSPHHNHNHPPLVATCQVSEARPLLEEQEAEKYINSEVVTREAIQAVEQDGEHFLVHFALGGYEGG